MEQSSLIQTDNSAVFDFVLPAAGTGTGSVHNQPPLSPRAQEAAELPGDRKIARGARLAGDCGP